MELSLRIDRTWRLNPTPQPDRLSIACPYCPLYPFNSTAGGQMYRSVFPVALSGRARRAWRVRAKRGALVLSASLCLLASEPAAAWASYTPTAAHTSSLCTRISSESLRALFTAKLSKPFFTSPYSGNDRCVYGVGPSAHLSGTALEFAKSGAVVDLISYGANAQYASNAKHISANVYTPLDHVGSRAFFVYLRSFPQAPAVYAQLGGLFCSVDLNIDNSNEVGLPSSSPARVAPSMEAELAKKEGVFCAEVFGHA